MSASKELEKDFNIKIESIINLDSLINFVKDDETYADYLDQLNKYRKTGELRCFLESFKAKASFKNYHKKRSYFF